MGPPGRVKNLNEDPDGASASSPVWSFTTVDPPAETVSTPVTPAAASDEGHTLEYQFYVNTSTSNMESGFGAQGWQTSLTLDFTFPAGSGGRYYSRVQARCADHTYSVSNISNYDSIQISN